MKKGLLNTFHTYQLKEDLSKKQNVIKIASLIIKCLLLKGHIKMISILTHPHSGDQVGFVTCRFQRSDKRKERNLTCICS